MIDKSVTPEIMNIVLNFIIKTLDTNPELVVEYCFPFMCNINNILITDQAPYYFKMLQLEEISGIFESILLEDMNGLEKQICLHLPAFVICISNMLKNGETPTARGDDAENKDFECFMKCILYVSKINKCVPIDPEIMINLAEQLYKNDTLDRLVENVSIVFHEIIVELVEVLNFDNNPILNNILRLIYSPIEVITNGISKDDNNDVVRDGLSISVRIASDICGYTSIKEKFEESILLDIFTAFLRFTQQFDCSILLLVSYLNLISMLQINKYDLSPYSENIQTIIEKTLSIFEQDSNNELEIIEDIDIEILLLTTIYFFINFLNGPFKEAVVNVLPSLYKYLYGYIASRGFSIEPLAELISISEAEIPTISEPFIMFILGKIKEENDLTSYEIAINLINYGLPIPPEVIKASIPILKKYKSDEIYLALELYGICKQQTPSP